MATTPDSVTVNIVPNTPPPSGISPKVWASTVGTLVASLVMAVLAALISNPADLTALLDAVPPWARFVIVAALPTLLSFVAGYAKRDTTRELGVAMQDRLSTPSAPEPADHLSGVDDSMTYDGFGATISDPGPTDGTSYVTPNDDNPRGERHAQ